MGRGDAQREIVKSGKDAAGDQGVVDRDDDAPDPHKTDALVTEAGKRLLNIIERVERLDGEIGTIRDDIKQVLAEGEGMGFQKKFVRKLIKIRKQDADERREEEAILETYMIALGMIEGED